MFVQEDLKSRIQVDSMAEIERLPLSDVIKEAEEIKNNQGLVSSGESVAKTLYLLIDPLILEIKKLLAYFY